MIYASKTITGLRSNNEDSVAVKTYGGGRILFAAVADGMGGPAAGEIASRTVTDTMAEELDSALIDSEAERTMRNSIRAANLEVYRLAQDNSDYRGMGSTLVCAVVSSGSFTAANIGDSRLYLFSGGSLKQITRDHSLVASLVSSGIITEEQAMIHPMRNVITRAVGIEPTVSPDIYTGTWECGDTLLLCSDGLHGVLNADSLAGILGKDLSLNDLCDNLVNAASDAGSTDNISVILIRHEGGDPA
ncbi:MAG: Stp1/IreP family PP2C-type Ser/Thr phosphatase [Clostridia bacterium]|nr:Stp1/IreP family PP2C-type Ser/Thr phosphatase [Clostridia bacterium]